MVYSLFFLIFIWSRQLAGVLGEKYNFRNAENQLVVY
jgi:hypothetical protein